MISKILTFLMLLAFGIFHAQNNFSEDPLAATFETKDYINFWQAYDKMGTSSENPFEEYIKNGSPALRAFPYRVMSADSLMSHVRKNKSIYESTRDIIKALPSKEKRLKAIYSALKYWYPQAKFPPVYFVYGLGYSGGTSTSDGLIIGTEVMKTLDGLPALAAHELVHFQQHVEGEQNLLKQCLIEGGADFIGEMISGENINASRAAYGETHSDNLLREFVARLKQEDYRDWLYSTSKKGDRPNDLGYGIGYKITQAYFNKQADKKQAIYNILHISDPMQFLKQSGFLEHYIADYQKSKNEPAEKFYQLLSDELYKVQFVVTVPEKTDDVFITGNQDALGKWLPDKVKLKRKNNFERTVTLMLHKPAKFKFTKGSWDKQADIAGAEKGNNITVENLKPNMRLKYKIKDWF